MEVITFDTLPEAVRLLHEKIDRLEGAFKNLNTSTGTVNLWMNIDELREYLPDHPSKQTIYLKVSQQIIPYRKVGRALMFERASIDAWLRGENPAAFKADNILNNRNKKSKHGR